MSLSKILSPTPVVFAAALVVGCMGANSTQPDKVPYQAGDTGVIALTCDEMKGCFSTCFDCAIEDQCAAEYAACTQDEDCTTLSVCLRACPEDDKWEWCHDLCIAEHGVPNAVFLDLWQCTYCDTCATSCAQRASLDCAGYPAGYPKDTRIDVPSDGLQWQPANLTWYTSYPEEGSAECLYYNGCAYRGYFAYFGSAPKPIEWVRANNIAAVHSKDFNKFKGKTLRIRQDGREIDVRVYDMCSDLDCDNCCTRNSQETGFLIDLEQHTLERLGGHHGLAEFACLDCD